MPNLVAYIALLLFPLVVVVLFRRMDKPTALIWSVLLGYLFLPERSGIDLPLLPEFNKDLVPSLFAGLMLLTTADTKQRRLSRSRPLDVQATAVAPKPVVEGPENVNRSVRGTRRTKKTARIQRSWVITLCLFALFVIIPIGTYLTNTDPLVVGPRRITGLVPYDIFSMVLETGVMLLPFLLGRYYLHAPETQTALLRAFVVCGLVYTVLMLVEIRLSPQLHRWVYGFHAHDFIQHIRGGAYRPMVFVGHGLRVGIFMCCAVLAALVLYKMSKSPKDMGLINGLSKKKLSFGLVTLWLIVVLFLSRNLGAFMIVLILAPVIFLFSIRIQSFMALAVGLTVALYPMLRQSDIVPVDVIYNVAASINEDRATSFQGRLNNEDMLLLKASERPIFGWGGWGRSRVFDERTGADLSVTDGIWVIIFGLSGWAGYLAQFGLLIFPILLLFRHRNSDAISPATYGLALMLSANLLDLIPNSGLTPLTWLIAGALLGAVERQTNPRDVPVKAARRRVPKTSRRIEAR